MNQIRPVLKGLHSPDVADLERFSPEVEDCFGILLQAFFGPDNADGEESFDMIVCTPKWIEQQLIEGAFSGLHHLIVSQFELDSIRLFLTDYARGCVGSTWEEVGEKLSRIGKWEFEDYTDMLDGNWQPPTG